jgi:hypothetical protein
MGCGNDMDAVNLLASETFRYGAFPLGSAALGIWLKCETRHMTKQNVSKEDFAVGMQLIQTACLTFLTLMTQSTLKLAALQQSLIKLQPAAPEYIATVSQAAQRVSALAGYTWTLFFMCISMMGVAGVVRRWGWKDADHMNVFLGIALPIAVGVVCLFAVMQIATEML